MQRLAASLPTNPDVRCSSRNPYEALGLDARRLDTIEHTDVAAAYVAALRQIDIPAALTRTQRNSAMARVGQAVDAAARLMTTDQRERIDLQLQQDLAPLQGVASPIADAAYSGYRRAIAEGREVNVEALVQQATSALHIDIDALMDNPGGQAQQGRHRAQGQFGIASARAGTDWVTGQQLGAGRGDGSGRGRGAATRAPRSSAQRGPQSGHRGPHSNPQLRQ